MLMEQRGYSLTGEDREQWRGGLFVLWLWINVNEKSRALRWENS